MAVLRKSLTDGAFQRVIPDEEVKLKQAKTLVFCSGKFYYDLIDARKERREWMLQ